MCFTFFCIFIFDVVLLQLFIFRQYCDISMYLAGPSSAGDQILSFNRKIIRQSQTSSNVCNIISNPIYSKYLPLVTSQFGTNFKSQIATYTRDSFLVHFQTPLTLIKFASKEARTLPTEDNLRQHLYPAD